MPTSPRLAHHVLAAFAAAIVVTSCAGGGSDNVATLATETNAPQGSEEFGLTTEELASRIEQVEAAIGTCMQHAGFEYVPVDFETVYDAMGSSGTAPGVSDEDYLAQFGFGITTRVGEPDPVVVNGRGEQNIAIYDALAPNDQVAYERALWGENPDVTFARALEDEDFSEAGGCTLTAAEPLFSDEELSGVYENPVDVLVNSDPRMVDALAAWAACMAEAGYPYDVPDDVDDDLAERLDAILGAQDPADLTGAELDALTELQGYERAVASVATDCEEEQLVPVEEQIETELYGAPQG